MADVDVQIAIEAVNKSRAALRDAEKDMKGYGTAIEAVDRASGQANRTLDKLASELSQTRAQSKSAASAMASVRKQMADGTLAFDAGQRKLQKLGTELKKSDTRAGQLSREMKQLKTSMAQVSDAAQKTSGSLTAMRDAAMRALAAGAIVGGAAKLGAELFKVGASALRAEASLNALTSGQADEFINAITTATQGTVSEMGAATVATNAFGLGLVSTAEEAGEFARVAAILGGTFRGLGAEQAAEEFGLLLANMSTQRLDTFGISSGVVRDRIKELQAATEGMTRSQAFQIATMEQATLKADTLGDTLSDATSEVDRFNATISDAKVAAGTFVATGLNPIIGGVRLLTEAQRENNAIQAELANEILLTSDSAREYNVALRDAGLTTSEFGATSERAFQSSKELAEQTAILAEANEFAGSEAERHADAQRILADAQLDAALATELSTEEIRAQEEAFRTTERAASDTISQLDDIAAAQAAGPLAGADAADLLIENMERMGASQQQILDRQIELNLSTGEWTESTLAQAEALAGINALQDAGLISGDEAIELTQEAIDQNLGLDETLAGLGDTVIEAGGTAEQGFNAIDRAALVTKGVVDKAGTESAASIDLITTSGDKATKSLDKARRQADEFRKSLQSIGTVSVRASVTFSGAPGFAGGGDFITSGVTPIIVGDNPGGRERVQITPLSGRGRTTGGSGGSPIRAAGGLGENDNGGQQTVNLILDGQVLMSFVYDGMNQDGVLDVPLGAEGIG